MQDARGLRTTITENNDVKHCMYKTSFNEKLN